MLRRKYEDVLVEKTGTLTSVSHAHINKRVELCAGQDDRAGPTPPSSGKRQLHERSHKKVIMHISEKTGSIPRLNKNYLDLEKFLYAAESSINSKLVSLVREPRVSPPVVTISAKSITNVLF
jgi:hypothetical protein